MEVMTCMRQYLNCIWMYYLFLACCNGQTTTIVPRNAEVIEGDDVTLTCEISTTVLYTNWRVNGGATAKMGYVNNTCSSIGFIDNDKYSYSCNSTIFKLTIHHVDNIQHGDVWYCIAAGNSFGANSTITVLVPPKSVTITPTKNKLRVKENTMQQFTCTTSEGRPEASVSWFKLQSGTRTIVIQNVTSKSIPNSNTGLSAVSSTLEFVPNRSDNGASVNCEASNKANSDRPATSAERKLDILYPPTVHRLSNVTIIEGKSPGSPVICRVSPGNPSSTNITLFKENVIKRTQHEVTLLQLPLNNVHREDSGTYVCVAENEMDPTFGKRETGKDSSQFTLSVYYESSITQFQVNHHSGFTEDITVDENDDITIKCVTDSNPGSTIEIEKDNVLKQKAVNTNEVVYRLHNTTCLDAGTYRCVAYNEAIGQVSRPSKQLRLHVKCGPRLSPINETKQNQTGPLCTTSAIRVYILAYPAITVAQVTWKKRFGNRFEVIRDNGTRVMIENHGITAEVLLVFQSVRLSDFGEYSLEIDLVLHDIQIFFVAKEVPAAPQHLAVLSSTITDASVVIQWNPGFDGGLSQTFVISYWKDGSTNRAVRYFADTKSPVQNATLAALDENTEYIVQVYAFNAEGNGALTRNSVAFKTLAERNTGVASSSVVGISVGACVAIVTIAISVVVIIKRHRRLKTKADKETKDRDKTDAAPTVPVSEATGDSNARTTDGIDMYEICDVAAYEELQKKDNQENKYSSLYHDQDGDKTSKTVYVNTTLNN